MNRAELLFKDKGIFNAGAYLYKKQTAIDFINACRAFDIPILGIDALLIGADFTQPSMRNSIDFTASPYSKNPPENIWEASTTFLQEIDDKYHIEIVCL